MQDGKLYYEANKPGQPDAKAKDSTFYAYNLKTKEIEEATESLYYIMRANGVVYEYYRDESSIEMRLTDNVGFEESYTYYEYYE